MNCNFDSVGHRDFELNIIQVIRVRVDGQRLLQVAAVLVKLCVRLHERCSGQEIASDLDQVVVDVWQILSRVFLGQRKDLKLVPAIVWETQQEPYVFVVVFALTKNVSWQFLIAGTLNQLRHHLERQIEIHVHVHCI